MILTARLFAESALFNETEVFNEKDWVNIILDDQMGKFEDDDRVEWVMDSLQEENEFTNAVKVHQVGS